MKVEDRDFEDPAEDRKYTNIQRAQQYRHRKNGGCALVLAVPLALVALLWRLLR